jgi:hypothetical protein
VTDDEVLELLRKGNEARTAATAAFRQGYDGADSEVAKCWAAHMLAVMSDSPEEKLSWNMESLRAAEAAGTDPRSSSLFPMVLGNIGFSTLLMARPAEARSWYERALKALESTDLDGERRGQYELGITHMLSVIDTATGQSDS